MLDMTVLINMLTGDFGKRANLAAGFARHEQAERDAETTRTGRVFPRSTRYVAAYPCLAQGIWTTPSEVWLENGRGERMFVNIHMVEGDGQIYPMYMTEPTTIHPVLTRERISMHKLTREATEATFDTLIDEITALVNGEK